MTAGERKYRGKARPVLTAALLLGSAMAAGRADSQGLPVFHASKGIGIYRPFNQMLPQPNANGTLFQHSWKCFFQAPDFARLKQAGFDMIRIFVEPEIFWRLDARGQKASLDDIGAFVKTANAGGLKVIVVLAATPGRPRDAKVLTQSPANDIFRDYRGAVTQMAKYLSGLDARNVAFELFNEPPGPCHWTDRPDWPQFQELIYQDARKAAPGLTLVLTGACAAAAESFQYLPADADYVKDPNTFIVAHYYDPYDFTLQGSGDRRKYLTGMPYPADPSARPAIEAATAARIDKAPLGMVDKALAQHAASNVIAEYFRNGYDQAYIDRKFAMIEAWRKAANVPAGRILLGEFGVQRKYGPNGADGALPADRLRWHSWVRMEAEKLGYPWLIWGYYGNMSPFDDDPPSWQIPQHHFDPGMIKALGLSPQANDPIAGEAERQVCPAR